MTAPYLGMGMPADDGWIARRFEDLQRQLNELRAARTLEAATIGRGGLTIDGGTLTITGNGIAESGDYQAGVSGWALEPNGNAEFNNLTLRGGIIGNDALANPIMFGSADQSVSNLNMPSATSVLTTANIAVPAGFTTAAILVSVQVGLSATSTASSGVQAVASVMSPSAVDGDIIAGLALAGQAMSIPATLATALTGLSVGSITVAVKGNYFGSAPQSNTGNGHVTALAIFTR